LQPVSSYWLTLSNFSAAVIGNSLDLTHNRFSILHSKFGLFYFNVTSNNVTNQTLANPTHSMASNYGEWRKYKCKHCSFGKSFFSLHSSFFFRFHSCYSDSTGRLFVVQDSLNTSGLNTTHVVASIDPSQSTRQKLFAIQETGLLLLDTVKKIFFVVGPSGVSEYSSPQRTKRLRISSEWMTAIYPPGIGEELKTHIHTLIFQLKPHRFFPRATILSKWMQ
jgi:hypothetical protein